MPSKNLTGEQIGFWSVGDPYPVRGKPWNMYYHVTCKCGYEHHTTRNNLMAIKREGRSGGCANCRIVKKDTYTGKNVRDDWWEYDNLASEWASKVW